MSINPSWFLMANQLRCAKIPGSVKVVDQVELANILETGVKNLNKDLQSLIWNSLLLWNKCGNDCPYARIAMTKCGGRMSAPFTSIHYMSFHHVALPCISLPYMALHCMVYTVYRYYTVVQAHNEHVYEQTLQQITRYKYRWSLHSK